MAWPKGLPLVERKLVHARLYCTTSSCRYRLKPDRGEHIYVRAATLQAILCWIGSAVQMVECPGNVVKLLSPGHYAGRPVLNTLQLRNGYS